VTAAGGPPDPPGTHPAAFHDGPAHVIRWGNPAFAARYGSSSLGMPAREAMTDLPRAAFALMDRVLAEGRPLARRILTPDGERRLVVVPRKDIETGEPYGVTTHIRPPGPPRSRAGHPA
jgi:PAS domain-containing protein